MGASGGAADHVSHGQNGCYCQYCSCTQNGSPGRNGSSSQNGSHGRNCSSGQSISFHQNGSSDKDGASGQTFSSGQNKAGRPAAVFAPMAPTRNVAAAAALPSTAPAPTLAALHAGASREARGSECRSGAGRGYAECRREQDVLWAAEAVAKGVAYARKGRAAEALQAYDHALELSPFCVDALVAKGACLVTLARQVRKAQGALFLGRSEKKRRTLAGARKRKHAQSGGRTEKKTRSIAIALGGERSRALAGFVAHGVRVDQPCSHTRSHPCFG